MTDKLEEKEDKKDIIEQAKDEFALAFAAVKDDFEAGVEDLEFVFAEDQWDDADKTARSGRPCLTVNDLPTFLDQVTGEARQNVPSISVIPVDDKTDPKKAAIIGGLCRAIEQDSRADIAYTTALECSAGGAFGAIRVLTEWIPGTFKQRIKIKPVENGFSVLFDPEAKEWDRSDGKFWFIFDQVTRESFEELYPDKELSDIGEDLNDKTKDWFPNGGVRIAEYFRKEFFNKTIYQLQDGRIVTELMEGEVPVKERTERDYKIIWRKISGKEVLEGPIELPGRYAPISPCRGKEVNINGQRKTRGLFRYSHGSQSMYNYWRSAATEFIGLSPKVPYVATAQMIANYKDQWESANDSNKAVLLFDADPNMPGVRPQREPAPQAPQAMNEQVAMIQSEKRNVIGIQEAGLGRRSNETSQVAIKERRDIGLTGNYAYIDNLSRCITHVFKIIVDLIPKVYDTARIEKILGIDGTEQMQPINQEYSDPLTGEIKKFDLTLGEHDVVVKVGPGYHTQRQEAKDQFIQLMQYAPASAPLITDIVAGYIDVAGADKISERLKCALPPEIRQAEEAKKQGGDGKIPIFQAQQMIQGEVQKAITQFQESLVGKELQVKLEVQNLKKEQEEIRLAKEKIGLDMDENTLKQKIAATTKDMLLRGELNG